MLRLFALPKKTWKSLRKIKGTNPHTFILEGYTLGWSVCEWVTSFGEVLVFNITFHFESSLISSPLPEFFILVCAWLLSHWSSQQTSGKLRTSRTHTSHILQHTFSDPLNIVNPLFFPCQQHFISSAAGFQSHPRPSQDRERLPGFSRCHPSEASHKLCHRETIWRWLMSLCFLREGEGSPQMSWKKMLKNKTKKKKQQTRQWIADGATVRASAGNARNRTVDFSKSGHQLQQWNLDNGGCCFRIRVRNVFIANMEAMVRCRHKRDKVQ